MRRPSMLSVPLALALTTGCYTYAPVEPASIRPGVGIRARVSSAAADRLAPLLGISNPRVVSGRLVDTRVDTILVDVPTVMQASIGSSVETLHQRISISRSELVELETRRLDRFRTAAIAGGVAIIVGAIAVGALGDDPGYSGPPGPGNGNDSRLPLWRLKF